MLARNSAAKTEWLLCLWIQWHEFLLMLHKVLKGEMVGLELRQIVEFSVHSLIDQLLWYILDKWLPGAVWFYRVHL